MVRWTVRSLIIAILLTGCATVSADTAPTIDLEPNPGVTDGRASPAGYFRFHSDPWLNLHHFLYHLAREDTEDITGWSRVPIRAEDRETASSFPAEFAAAVATYTTLRHLDLLYDENLSQIRRSLQRGGPGNVQNGDIRRALEAAMPHYLAHYWPEHQTLNKEALAQLSVLLETHEAAMAARLAAEIDGRWPEASIRIDFSVYTNWAGAYTDNNPNNIVLSTSDPDTQLYIFEILFHESAHTDPLGTKLYEFARAEVTAAGLDDPRFWHSVLFYASGEAATDVLGSDYVPYAIGTQVWSRRGVAGHLEALERGWREGENFEERVRAAVAALGAADE